MRPAAVASQEHGAAFDRLASSTLIVSDRGHMALSLDQ